MLGRRIRLYVIESNEESGKPYCFGGACSGIPFVNLEALIDLKKLTCLCLHEFGKADIIPLTRMKQLKRLALKYANEILNIDSIASMDFLVELELDGLSVDNLDFLDALPDTLSIVMCGNHVHGSVDVHKWKRFAEHDICEISVYNERFKYYEDIDLSVIN